MGRELALDRTTEEHINMATDEIVTLRTFAIDLHAEMARAMLDSHGIHAVLSRDNCGGLEPQLTIAGGTRLMVNRDVADEALALLDNADRRVGRDEEE